jgi:hypothetical protein
MSYDPVEIHQRFRSTCGLLQGRRINEESSQKAAGRVTLQKVALFIFIAVRN